MLTVPAAFHRDVTALVAPFVVCLELQSASEEATAAVARVHTVVDTIQCFVAADFALRRISCNKPVAAVVERFGLLKASCICYVIYIDGMTSVYGKMLATPTVP